MKIISYTALHYGKEYLGYAIRSVIDAVDEHWILYTPVGSHGSRTPIPCPDTRDELYAIASAAAGNKLRWVERDDWFGEGQQRDSIHQYAPDADVILTVDADEVWSANAVQGALASYYTAEVNHYERLRLGMVHYWRSFYRCILHDPALPERVIFPRIVGETVTTNNAGNSMLIHHFGYAQRPEIVQYKILTHGHRGEWRHDVDWFRDRFMANAQTDCHPVGSEWWNPETVDPFALGLPEWMHEHPCCGMEVIGEILR